MSTDRGDLIKDAIQDVVEDGWAVTHYVSVAAFEKFVDGEYSTATVLFVGLDQPDYISNGLLLTGVRIQERSER